MQVLLKRSVEHLGRIGDVVTVKPGFARNYLLPRGFAAPLNAGNVAEIERLRALAKAEEQDRVKSFRETAQQLTGVSVTIEGRANDEGHLFGSVTATQIGAALRAKGFDVQDGHVKLDAPIKSIGVFDVRLHLHQEVDATLKVWVVQSKPD